MRCNHIVDFNMKPKQNLPQTYFQDTHNAYIMYMVMHIELCLTLNLPQIVLFNLDPNHSHDEIKTWNCFPNIKGPLFGGTYQSRAYSTHKGSVMWSFVFSLLNKQSSCKWFEMGCSCDITVIFPGCKFTHCPWASIIVNHTRFEYHFYIYGSVSVRLQYLHS